MTTEVHPALGLGTPFTDECGGDGKGVRCQTELYREQVKVLDRAVYEGFGPDRSTLIRYAVADWIDAHAPHLADEGKSDVRARLYRMRERAQFHLDTDHHLEHLPAQMCAAFGKLLAHCDHKKLAEEVLALWDDAQAGDEYWQRQLTAMFRGTAVLSSSVATLHRVGWPLPGDLVSYVLGGAASSSGGSAPGGEPDCGTGADPSHDPGDMEGEP